MGHSSRRHPDAAMFKNYKRLVPMVALSLIGLAATMENPGADGSTGSDIQVPPTFSEGIFPAATATDQPVNRQRRPLTRLHETSFSGTGPQPLVPGLPRS